MRGEQPDCHTTASFPLNLLVGGVMCQPTASFPLNLLVGGVMCQPTALFLGEGNSFNTRRNKQTNRVWSCFSRVEGCLRFMETCLSRLFYSE
jgi:hypothetical protein